VRRRGGGANGDELLRCAGAAANCEIQRAHKSGGRQSGTFNKRLRKGVLSWFMTNMYEANYKLETSKQVCKDKVNLILMACKFGEKRPNETSIIEHMNCRMMFISWENNVIEMY